MYAFRRINVKQWKHQTPDERYTVRIGRGGKPVLGIQERCIAVLEEEVMYWRKANHIHAWFVDNVQDGADDCEPYRVELEKLIELNDVCKKVIGASKLVDGLVKTYEEWNSELKIWEPHREPGGVVEDPTTAIELLPTRDGFFFGNTEYDSCYLDDVLDTHEWAERMIDSVNCGVPGDIYYRSSW